MAYLSNYNTVFSDAFNAASRALGVGAWYDEMKNPLAAPGWRGQWVETTGNAVQIAQLLGPEVMTCGAYCLVPHPRIFKPAVLGRDFPLGQPVYV